LGVLAVDGVAIGSAAVAFNHAGDGTAPTAAAANVTASAAQMIFKTGFQRAALISETLHFSDKTSHVATATRSYWPPTRL